MSANVFHGPAKSVTAGVAGNQSIATYGGQDNSGLTERSVRIAEKATTLERFIDEIEGKVRGPVAPSPGGPVPSTPSHITFALEAAEQSLERAYLAAERIAAAL